MLAEAADVMLLIVVAVMICVAARIGVELRPDPYAIVYPFPVPESQKLTQITAVAPDTSAVMLSFVAVWAARLVADDKVNVELKERVLIVVPTSAYEIYSRLLATMQSYPAAEGRVAETSVIVPGFVGLDVGIAMYCRWGVAAIVDLNVIMKY